MDPRDDLRPSVSDDTVEVVRSEEELDVGMRVVPRERVRIGKRVVSETVTRSVEVRREELYLERLGVDAGAAPGPDGGSQEEVLEFVLHEEEVQLVTRVVPRERVRVRKELVTERLPVNETLRREEIEVEADRGLDLDR